MKVNVHAAKSQLSRLIERAQQGEEVIIARNGSPVARLVPLDRKPPARTFGAMKGRARVDEGFFEPLPEEELKRWGG